MGENGKSTQATMKFGSHETLEAVAKAMNEVSDSNVISIELDRRRQGKLGYFDKLPEDDQTDPNILSGEAARQVRRFIGEVAAGEHPEVDRETKKELTFLDEVALNLNEKPHDLDAEFAELVHHESTMSEVEDRIR
jgi:hypothetical protein